MGFLFLYRAHPTLNSVIAGSLFIAIGECIRLVGAGTLRKYKGVVSQNGIYAYTRNPLYMGSFLLGIGACIIGRDPLFALLFPLLFIPVYYHVIKREEAFLFKQYGSEYEQYRKRVPRLFPRRINIPYIFREASIAKSFNNREWKTLVGITAVLVVMVAKLYLQ